MTTAVGRQPRTLSDVLIPFTGSWADIAIIVAGSLLIAAAAQIRFSLPFTPVPITGFGGMLELGLWPFMAGDLAKIVLVSLTLPSAWSLLTRFDPGARHPRDSDSRVRGEMRPDGNP